MKLQNAITMLKKHGSDFRAKRKKETIYYMAEVGDSTLGFFAPCGNPGQASATLLFRGKDKSGFTGRSLTASIRYAKEKVAHAEPTT
jgi:hypothetical protein